MRIISIDPGFERLGIAVLDRELKKKECLVYSECFKTSSRLSHPERLALIGKKIKDVVVEFLPKAMSIEKLFFNTNARTALAVAEARGVIVYEGAAAGLQVFEYTPLQIKIAVTGYGRSDKKQIMAMIPRLIVVDKKISSDDEFDAIACGLTCFAREQFT